MIEIEYLAILSMYRKQYTYEKPISLTHGVTFDFSQFNFNNRTCYTATANLKIFKHQKDLENFCFLDPFSYYWRQFTIILNFFYQGTFWNENLIVPL